MPVDLRLLIPEIFWAASGLSLAILDSPRLKRRGNKQYITPQQTYKKSKAQSASAPRVFSKTTQKSIIFGQKP